MVGLRDIPRTAAFTWSPGPSPPFIATGTRAGAVDADFSSDTQLELWDLDFNNDNGNAELKPVASVATDSRFHDIAWVQSSSGFEKGVIAGALENGSLDLWDTNKLLQHEGDALVSRTSKHSGAIKSLQFNPFRSELLATAGTKGELYVSDLNNIGSPFRLGTPAGRADDFECLDWNKKVPHIMVTGSNGGFVTIWDVKSKKESLTLNNSGRKPVSAVAWDPEKPTRLITAVPLDTDPLILVWDLRNSNAPEKVLRGHEGGVLSLSWCQQDNDLLLSCGKDNRTMCWNPQTGTAYGEFPVVTNWTFQTRWNPHNPSILATASFDGRIAVQTIQNTRSEKQQSAASQSLDGEDFFEKAAIQPQNSSFSLPKAPKWLERPSAASFAFGGKIVSLARSNSEVEGERKSIVRISSFTADEEICKMTESFAKMMKEHDLKAVCESHIAGTHSEFEKNDWEVIETLVAENPRKELIARLGYSEPKAKGEEDLSDPTANGDDNAKASSLDVDRGVSKKENRLSSFFDSGADGENFLADLASTRGAKTNNPFQLYGPSESQADKDITRALLLGHFDKAMEICLTEDRLSDAFMIAICGGQGSIDKVQQAYFQKQASGPKYLRLLASVVGKNLWDVVYNADVGNWTEVMAVLCTYAAIEDFSDLCEALGDRLEEQARADTSNKDWKKAASFCYIAGSKLDKIVNLWILDLAKNENEQNETSSKDTSFSLHAKALQSFIEKVTVFREVTKYQDNDLQAESNWKLAPLYEKYTEYADVAASHGQLQIAETYLELLPMKYPAAEVARNRVKQATRQSAPQQAAKQASLPTVLPNRGLNHPPAFDDQRAPQNFPNNQYTPSVPSQGQTSYMPPQSNQFQPAPYAPSQPPPQAGARPMIPPPPTFGGLSQPPPRNMNASPSMLPPSKATNMTNWNDTPEDFFKPPTSRRGTPSMNPPAINAPFVGQPSQVSSPPLVGQSFGSQPPPAAHTGPPPRNLGNPGRGMNPNVNQFQQPAELNSSTNTYAPPTVPQGPQGSHMGPPVPRGPSPYNAPPSAGPPPVSGSRYAPTPVVAPQQAMSQPPSQMAAPPRNPYASRPSYNNQPNPAQGQNQPPPPGGRPPQSTPPSAIAGGQPPEGAVAASAPKYPSGDRTHIPATAKPIYERLNDDMQRVKSKAPASFKVQVADTEKRLNILFDHLNNETLLTSKTINDMLQLSEAVQSKDYEKAMQIHVDIVTNRMDECVNWMTGVKRLIGMSRATNG